MKRYVKLSAAVAAAALVVGCGVSSPDSVVSAGELMTVPTAVSADADTGGGAAGAGDAPDKDAAAEEAPAGDAPADAAEPARLSTQADSPKEATASEEPTKSPSKSAASSISPAEAGARAAAAHAGSRVVEIELDRAHGTTVWEVTVVSANGRWQVDVELATGTVLSNRADHTDDLNKYVDRLAGAKVDHAAALTALLGLHPGSQLAELELDTEDGRVVWEADIVTDGHQKYEVRIDAVTGEVLKNELDD